MAQQLGALTVFIENLSSVSISIGDEEAPDPYNYRFTTLMLSSGFGGSPHSGAHTYT